MLFLAFLSPAAARILLKGIDHVNSKDVIVFVLGCPSVLEPKFAE